MYSGIDLFLIDHIKLGLTTVDVSNTVVDYNSTGIYIVSMCTQLTKWSKVLCAAMRHSSSKTIFVIILVSVFGGEWEARGLAEEGASGNHCGRVPEK